MTESGFGKISRKSQGSDGTAGRQMSIGMRGIASCVSR
jgi:hypothetical protein